mmetsp:Transcript_83829/g.241011  ORF Transcript_83829/g.241011 Transcript_83829/m.241011 type:complete len:639 (+) Transcript_83829:104-2020(+)
MPMKKFRMTNTELKLKRERLMSAFRAGKMAIEELGLPYFLANGSALGALREGQFQPFEDDIIVGIHAWDLAALQRACPEPTAARRDGRMIGVFTRCGFDPVSEVVEGGSAQGGKKPLTESACPRYFIAEGWTQEMAFPILYKFTHKESLVRFDILVFSMQFGQLWDFADGGAETSCGWRYSPFAPQPMEFEKMMTFTMPASALEEHYGQDWHVPRAQSYIENLSRCKNRCQVLRVLPWDASLQKLQLPSVPTWEEFRLLMRTYRIKYAKAMADAEHEVPAKPLDLYKIESKPMVLFQAAELCKTDGNERLKKGNASGALDKYDEGVYIMDKCREVLVTWRLIFRQIHNEKAENNRKDRGLKYCDMVEPDMPREFRGDETQEQTFRMALLLNAAQASLQLERWEAADARAGLALELDSKNLKALYRRGLARLKSGREELAKTDFWSMVRVSNFESKEALSQLMKLMPKEELQKQMKKVKVSLDKEHKLGSMITEMEGDDRISMQDERYQRYLADCSQRKADGQREISFDDWARQYEWRYDADERNKVRQAWPDCFSHKGAAPLPVEDWEVDYLTHKEIHKIMYNRQTAALGAKKREKEGPRPDDEAPRQEGFECKLEVDEEDEMVLRDAVVKRGYNYWW